MAQGVGEHLFEAKTKAKEALEHAHAGAEMAQDFLNDQLDQNLLPSNDELQQVSGGLGEEARELEGKGGPRPVLGK